MDASESSADGSVTPSAALLKTHELAALLRVDYRVAARLVRLGEFPTAFKVGKSWRIPVSDVEQFRRSHGPSANAPSGGCEAGS